MSRRSHEKIGDCEQSILPDVLSFFEIKTRNIQEFFASSEEK